MWGFQANKRYTWGVSLTWRNPEGETEGIGCASSQYHMYDTPLRRPDKGFEMVPPWLPRNTGQFESCEGGERPDQPTYVSEIREVVLS